VVDESLFRLLMVDDGGRKWETYKGRIRITDEANKKVVWINKHGELTEYVISQLQDKASAAGRGNLRSVKHGANSKALVRQYAGELTTQLIRMYPMVMDMPMTIVERYAMNDARCMMLYDYLFKVEEEEGFGATLRTGLHDQISKAESVSLQMAKELGLTPKSWSDIAKNMGFARHFSNENVGNLTSRGEAILQARAAAIEQRAG